MRFLLRLLILIFCALFIGSIASAQLEPARPAGLLEKMPSFTDNLAKIEKRPEKDY